MAPPSPPTPPLLPAMLFALLSRSAAATPVTAAPASPSPSSLLREEQLISETPVCKQAWRARLCWWDCLLAVLSPPNCCPGPSNASLRLLCKIRECRVKNYGVFLHPSTLHVSRSVGVIALSTLRKQIIIGRFYAYSRQLHTVPQTSESHVKILHISAVVPSEIIRIPSLHKSTTPTPQAARPGAVIRPNLNKSVNSFHRLYFQQGRKKKLFVLLRIQQPAGLVNSEMYILVRYAVNNPVSRRNLARMT